MCVVRLACGCGLRAGLSVWPADAATGAALGTGGLGWWSVAGLLLA